MKFHATQSLNPLHAVRASCPVHGTALRYESSLRRFCAAFIALHHAVGAFRRDGLIREPLLRMTETELRDIGLRSIGDGAYRRVVPFGDRGP